jgi:hypothetical protein
MQLQRQVQRHAEQLPLPESALAELQELQGEFKALGLTPTTREHLKTVSAKMR